MLMKVVVLQGRFGTFIESLNASFRNSHLYNEFTSYRYNCYVKLNR